MSRITLRRCLSVLAAVLFAVSVGATASAPAASASAGATPTPKHIWLDSAHPLDGGAFGFALVLTYPAFTGQAQTHVQAPRFTDGVTNCVAGPPRSPQAVSCTATGALVTGTYEITGDVSRSGGATLNWSAPITVCDGPCSPTFSVTTSPTTLRYLVNTELAAQQQASLNFNVDWNADPDRLRFGRPHNAQTIADGAYEIIAEQPKNGSKFGFHGKFTQTGDYSLDVSVTDEFGVPHDSSVNIHVCTPEECPDLVAALANTGTDGFSNVAWLTGGILALLAGAGILILRRRVGALP